MIHRRVVRSAGLPLSPSLGKAGAEFLVLGILGGSLARLRFLAASATPTKLRRLVFGYKRNSNSFQFRRSTGWDGRGFLNHQIITLVINYNSAGS